MAHAPHVALVEVCHGDPGLALVRSVRRSHPGARIVLWTEPGAVSLWEAMALVEGLLPQKLSKDALERALVNVSRGRPAVDPAWWPELFSTPLDA